MTPIEATTLRIHHDLLPVHTNAYLQFIDLTPRVQECVERSNIRDGMVTIQSQHTTSAIIVNEHEPLLLEDLRNTLERLAPRDVSYRHDDFSVRTVNLEPDERSNGHSHCKALFLRASETLNIAGGRVQLGRWQRVFLVELDGARDRLVSILTIGSSATAGGNGRLPVSVAPGAQRDASPLA